MRNRYYSAQQYEKMAKIDPLAKERNEEAERMAKFICMECGSVDVFTYETKTQHSIVIENDELVIRPNGFNNFGNPKIRLDQLLDKERERGLYFNPTCGRCGGAAIEKNLIDEHCEKFGCLGCMFCGHVSTLLEVEIKVDNCIACMGGDRDCDSNCPSKYMRKYYGIYDTTPGLLKAPENHEEERRSLSR